MKIVYCLPQLFHPGGIERIVSIKANYLVEVYGYDVTIVVANQKKQVPFFKLHEKIKIVDLNIDYDKALSQPLFKRLYLRHKLQKEHKTKLSKYLFTNHPDIVISTFTHEAAFLPQIKDGSKKVLEFHFCKGHKIKMAKAFHFGFITKLAYYYRCWQEENIIIHKYDQFVVLTDEDKNLWKNKINNVTNIPNILSFRNVDKYADLKSKTAIAVGRLDNQKGFDTLINMWAEIVKQCKDWKLNIFGQGEDEDYLNQLICKLNLKDSVFINRPDKNIQQRYLESSLLLMTSNYEGWGLVLTEAMQCGLPVVAFACKCGPKDIINNGVDGFCIPYKNKNLFVKHAIQLMNDEKLRFTMGYNARNNIQRYSIDNVMPKWHDLFNKLTNN